MPRSLPLKGIAILALVFLAGLYWPHVWEMMRNLATGAYLRTETVATDSAAELDRARREEAIQSLRLRTAELFAGTSNKREAPVLATSMSADALWSRIRADVFESIEEAYAEHPDLPQHELPCLERALEDAAKQSVEGASPLFVYFDQHYQTLTDCEVAIKRINATAAMLGTWMGRPQNNIRFPQ